MNSDEVLCNVHGAIAVLLWFYGANVIYSLGTCYLGRLLQRNGQALMLEMLKIECFVKSHLLDRKLQLKQNVD